MKKWILGGLGWCLAWSAWAQYPHIEERALEKKLWEEEHWLRLLHYKKHFFSGYESQADGEAFFLSPEGKTNPRAELLATLRAFYQPLKPFELLMGAADDHALCRFPARRMVLQQWLPLTDLPQLDCQAYRTYRADHHTQSVSLVFSSYHLESPSSAFGHTLLRLNKGGQGMSGKYFELLDRGINYAAVVTTENPVLYFLLGTFGGFRGTFSSIPYFYKVREYNDHEARDLWSYELNLSKSEIELLMAHLWELSYTHFDYYYFDENCSYHMLGLLEAVNPKLKLTAKLPFYSLPVDTLKAVASEKNLVRSLHFRPSARSKFEGLFDQLNPSEQALLEQFAEDRNLAHLKKVPDPATRVALFDAAIDYMDFKFSEQILLERGPDHQQIRQEKSQLLASRSQIPLISAPRPELQKEGEAPHLGHASGRVMLGQGVGRHFPATTTLGLRFALRDFLDPVKGHPKYVKIEFLNTELSYGDKFFLDRFALVDIDTLYPWHPLRQRLSFRLKLGARRFWGECSQDPANTCVAPQVESGFGLAREWQWAGGELLGNLFLNTDYAYHASFSSSRSRLGVGPLARLRILWSDATASHLRYQWQWFPTMDDKFRHELSWEQRWYLHQRWNVGLTASYDHDSGRVAAQNELRAQSQLYFFF